MAADPNCLFCKIVAGRAACDDRRRGRAHGVLHGHQPGHAWPRARRHTRARPRPAGDRRGGSAGGRRRGAAPRTGRQRATRRRRRQPHQLLWPRRMADDVSLPRARRFRAIATIRCGSRGCPRLAIRTRSRLRRSCSEGRARSPKGCVDPRAPLHSPCSCVSGQRDRRKKWRRTTSSSGDRRGARVCARAARARRRHAGRSGPEGADDGAGGSELPRQPVPRRQPHDRLPGDRRLADGADGGRAPRPNRRVDDHAQQAEHDPDQVLQRTRGRRRVRRHRDPGAQEGDADEGVEEEDSRAPPPATRSSRRGPVVPLEQYFGETTQFALEKTIEVKKGDIVALDGAHVGPRAHARVRQDDRLAREQARDEEGLRRNERADDADASSARPTPTPASTTKRG